MPGSAGRSILHGMLERKVQNSDRSTRGKGACRTRADAGIGAKLVQLFSDSSGSRAAQRVPTDSSTAITAGSNTALAASLNTSVIADVSSGRLSAGTTLP